MKKMLLACLMMLVASMSLVSCYTYQVTKYRYESAQEDLNQAYRGASKTQIINNLGAPDRTVPIDGYSVILIYETYTTNIKQPFDPWGLGIGSYTATTDRTFVEFYLDGNAKCYNVKTNIVNRVPYQETYKRSVFEDIFGFE